MNEKRLDLQGLRAIAVVAVMIFHMNADWLPGGYLGVDLFFVLSGYLMALVLSRHQQLGWSEIKGFYARRLARIAPAALFVAAVTAPFVLYTLLPFDMRDYSASLVGLVTGTLNIMVANNIGYFSPLADAQPLLHYWSLMVELHFYLLIPFVFWMAIRLRWSPVWLTVLLMGVSLGYAEYRVNQAPNDAYYLLASRAWEFLAGVLLFLTLRKADNGLLDAVAPWIGLAIVVWGFLFFDSSYQHPSLSSVIIIVGVVLLMRIPTTHLLAGVLSSRPLVYLGDISYSLYLWHNILIVLVLQKFGELQWLHAVAIAGATLLLAHFTRLYIEVPFLNGSSNREQWWRLSKKAFYWPLVAFLVLFGGYGFDSKGFADFWKSRVSDQSVRAYELYMEGKKYRELDAETDCFYRFGSVDQQALEQVRGCTDQHGKGVLVLGDSHSIGVFRALNWARIENKLKAPFVLNLSKGGCGVTTQKLDCFFHQLREDSSWIGENFDKVVYVQRGTGLLNKKAESERVLDEQRGETVLAFLSSLGEKTEVVWLGPRIEANRYVSQFVSSGCDAGIKPDQQYGSKLKKLNRELAAKAQTLRFIDAEAYDLKEYGGCDQLYWRDADHWTKGGVKAVSSRLLDLLELQTPNTLPPTRGRAGVGVKFPKIHVYE